MREKTNIDLAKFFKILFLNKKTIINFIIISVLIGVIISINSTVTYKSSVVFVPQTGDESNSSFNFNQIANIAGVNLPLDNNNSNIHPDLYPIIISDIMFKRDLFAIIDE